MLKKQSLNHEIPLEKIPSSIYQIELSTEDRKKLSMGLWTGLKKDIQLEDGSLRDGKLKASLDEDGALYFSFNFTQEKLEIPDKILNHKLSSDEKNKLENGEFVRINPKKGQELFLQVDNDLNKIVVKSAREVSALTELGGYQFTNQERKQLVNGKLLNSHVYKGKNGYFTADVKLTDDKMGIEFHNYKSLNKKEAQKLSGELNKADEKVSKVENAVSASNLSSDKNEEIKHTGVFEKPLAEKDYARVRELVKSGNKPPEALISKITSSKTLTQEQKIEHLSALGKDPFKVMNPEKYKKLQNDHVKNSGKNKKASVEKAAYTGKEIAQQAFRDM